MKFNKEIKDKNELKKLFNSSKTLKITEFKGYFSGDYFKTKSFFGFLLNISNWKGKEFISKNNVNALCHKIGNKTFKPILGKSTLKSTTYQGSKVIAMKYKYLPITDYFKKIDDKTFIGIMTIFNCKKPVLYFYLKK